MKTRELHKSTVNNALRSLLSPEARDLFDESKARRFNPADVLSGKILIASLNSVSHPNLAALLFKALKRDFYESVLSRTAMKPAEDRLCGLILDELPLSVMSEDVEALALLRSKGGFVVACSQGINGLDEAIGQRQRRALMANFNSVFYFASREDQTDEHAMLTLGMHEDSERANDTHGHGNLQVEEPARPPNSRWICTPGSLARLPQHHAYAKLANGTVTKAPVWMEPGFHDFTAHPAVSKPDDLAEAIASLKSDDEDVPQTQPDVPLLLVHMHRQRHPLRLTPSVVAATWQLCKPRVRRSQLLPRLGRQIQGIENLPSCWLLGLLQWIRKNPNLAPGIVRVSVRSGVLWPELDQAWTLWGDGPLTFPESINRFVYSRGDG
ncbi:MAG: type IV secretion system DNA-binding domain-containing protein [Verrucomicrobia bacterium]|nr:type IV secretion system DNA-binding domain-containing protein [Verrucomicrobiota bacterium]